MEKMSLSRWANYIGIHYNTAKYRFHKGLIPFSKQEEKTKRVYVYVDTTKTKEEQREEQIQDEFDSLFNK